ncbi:ABC transporter ATP-binding protein [Terrihabitans sp. B22-R8]|uniref:ABC transporter ATP-binding protein n=1 Tax=Terrihabitans sp. B22-R8 TaxID=3425128 RepID=UPI00403C07E1
MSTPLLQIENLSFGPAGRTLAKGVNVRLEAGEVLALLGPNGAGKTTFLKTLLHLQPPPVGRVSVYGEDIANWSPARRAMSLAYVPQSSGGQFAFSVLDTVLMGRTARRSMLEGPTSADHDAAYAALNDLGISHLAGRRFTGISGGERQLVLIARALAQEARILVLDEPTASLDFANQERVLAVLSWLAKRNFAVLFSTHHPDQAFSVAHNVLLLSRCGEILQGPALETMTESNLTRLYGTAVVIKIFCGKVVCFTNDYEKHSIYD